MTDLIPVESIIGKIVFLRGEKVLLDRDLAELYGVETKQLKRAVRRNVKRFPKDFMFELTKKEFDNLRYQSGTSNWADRDIYQWLSQNRVWSCFQVCLTAIALSKSTSQS